MVALTRSLRSLRSGELFGVAYGDSLASSAAEPPAAHSWGLRPQTPGGFAAAHGRGLLRRGVD